MEVIGKGEKMLKSDSSLSISDKYASTFGIIAL